jgi:hypothetical protein
MSIFLLACSLRSADSPVPEPPWTVVFDDGSHNVTTVVQPAGGPATFSYVPMTPERSSSGTFSGGPPATGDLGADATRALWQHIATLRDDPAAHADQRRMGTGLLTLEASGGRTRLLLAPEPTEALAGLLETWR